MQTFDFLSITYKVKLKCHIEQKKIKKILTESNT